ncbi:expressed unknown protein [Seminavis robusta]|uniref:Uncharacterized protein n=1 Tax=Seminavis robusta TaxID=568900 RepID=A0A9N8HCN7_9STRA|nr:expressed unknown protein [Seminavis robusta]|eukprot:Sro420_g139260.1 n/a (533) ;mRNA; r:20917-22515
MTTLSFVAVAGLLLLLQITTSSAFVLPLSSRPCGSVSLAMRPDGFNDWMQPDGNDYDTHPHARNTVRPPAVQGGAGGQQSQDEMRRAYYQEPAPPQAQQAQPEPEAAPTDTAAPVATAGDDPSVPPPTESQMPRDPTNDGRTTGSMHLSARDQELIDQMEQAQNQYDQFVSSPYGNSGPARYGHTFGQGPQVPAGQSQGPARPQQRTSSGAGPPPAAQQSSMDQFIENPYGNRPAPDGYGNSVGGGSAAMPQAPQAPGQYQQPPQQQRQQPPPQKSFQEDFIDDPYANDAAPGGPPVGNVDERQRGMEARSNRPPRSDMPIQAKENLPETEDNMQPPPHPKAQKSFQEQFIDDPYGGNKGAPKGGMEARSNFPPRSDMPIQAQENLPETEDNTQPPPHPKAQKSSQEQFIDDPYGIKSAPDGYFDTGVSNSMRQFQAHQKKQQQDQDFIDNPSGTNRMDYGFGQQESAPRKVLVRHQKRKRQPLSRQDNFINNPKGSTFKAGQYGYGNDGDNDSSGYFDYEDHDYGIEGRRE